ncbi:MAG: hypothetical protein QXJ19_03810 [Candidatus Bathyarchaeia archaeon]|nr:hypothetical protein [Candidatus Bathyarchaeota archaeon]
MLVDAYQKGWALRYLREAIDEINIARKDSRAFNLLLDALKKIEMAVYCSLGEPLLIENIVEDFVERDLMPRGPIIKHLVEIKKTIKRLENTLHERLDNTFFRELDNILSIASKIVDLITSLCAED